MPSGPGSHDIVANSILDATSTIVRSTGTPALSVQWGASADAGMASDETHLKALGVDTIHSSAGVAALGCLMSAACQDGISVACVQRFNWPRFRSIGLKAMPSVGYLMGRFVEQNAVSKTLGMSDGRSSNDWSADKILALVTRAASEAVGTTAGDLRVDQPLLECGLDSLAVVGFRNALASSLGAHITVPDTLLFDYPTIDAISGHLLLALSKSTQETCKAITSCPMYPTLEQTLSLVMSAACDAIGRPKQELCVGQPLTEIGMDSLAIVGFRNALASSLGNTIMLDDTLVYDHPTIDAIARHLSDAMSKHHLGESDAKQRRSIDGPVPQQSAPQIADVQACSPVNVGQQICSLMDSSNFEVVETPQTDGNDFVHDTLRKRSSVIPRFFQTLAQSQSGSLEFTVFAYLSTFSQGHPGIVHGGISATLCVEAMSSAFLCEMRKRGQLPAAAATCKTLRIDFVQPASVNQNYMIRCECKPRQDGSGHYDAKATMVSSSGSAIVIGKAEFQCEVSEFHCRPLRVEDDGTFAALASIAEPAIDASHVVADTPPIFGGFAESLSHHGFSKLTGVRHSQLVSDILVGGLGVLRAFCLASQTVDGVTQIYAFVRCGDGSEEDAGFVHRGLLTLLFDEFMCLAAQETHAAKDSLDRPIVTKNLSTKFRLPVTKDQAYVMHAKTLWSNEMCEVSGTLQSRSGEIHVVSAAEFVRIRHMVT